MYSKRKIAGLTEGEGKVVHGQRGERVRLYTVSKGRERLSGVREKLYGKHRMGEVFGSEGKAVR